MAAIELRVNGNNYSIDVDDGTPLLYVLRGKLGLKGAKYGCGTEQCGACCVIVDGVSTYSCSTPVEAFEGKEIETIEGIGTPESLHAIQRAFLKEGTGQCGYCIPGTIVAVKALLDGDSSPSESDIREALSPHLCRCGCHHDVLRAVCRALESGAQ